MPGAVIQLIVILGLATIAMAAWCWYDPYVRWLFWQSVRHPLSNSAYDPEKHGRRRSGASSRR
jgi:hypothetical protein